MRPTASLGLSRKVALATEVVGAYVSVRWYLWRGDFPAALARIRDVPPVGRGGGQTDEQLARAVRRTLRRLPADSRCLMQSLVLTRLLASRGRTSRLVIGVDPGAAFGAHAWIEREEVPLLPANAHRFQRLAEL